MRKITFVKRGVTIIDPAANVAIRIRGKVSKETVMLRRSKVVHDNLVLSTDWPPQSIKS